jgi:hypothetical protein
MDGSKDGASILVPGRSHLLSAEINRMNAPRVLREVRGDFEVRVRIKGVEGVGSRATTSRYAPWHCAGILLWKDAANYVRLEIAAEFLRGKVQRFAQFEFRRDGRLASSLGQPIEDGSPHLRLRRWGEEVYGSFGPDGRHWTSFAPFLASFPDPVEVGIVAINSSTKPLEAEFTGFQILSGPRAGSGGDGAGARVLPEDGTP